jgi:hypothetical protein
MIPPHRMPQVVTFDVDDRGQRAPARGVGEFVRGRQADEKKPRRSEAFSISVHGLRNETFRSKPIHDARIGSKVLWLIAAPTSALSSDQRDCGKGGCWSPKPSIRRAIGCFRAAGFQVEPYPVAFKTGGPSHSFSPYATGSGAFYLLDLAVKEWIGGRWASVASRRGTAEGTEASRTGHKPWANHTHEWRPLRAV